MKKILFALVAIDVCFSIINNLKIKTIMGNQKEAAQELAAFKTQLVKANTEIQAKIQQLIDAAANTEIDPELRAAIDELKPVAQALDDIVPDEPTEPPTEPEG